MKNTPASASPADILRAMNLGNRAGITVAEFARLFGRKRGWGYRRIARGEIAAIETSGNLIIPLPELLKFIAAK